MDADRRWKNWPLVVTYSENGSNVSYAQNSPESTAVIYKVYLWLCTLVSPVTVFVGIPVSIMVIGCMPFTSINRKPRMFYIMFATCNLSPLVQTHLLIYFLMTLYHLKDDLLERTSFGFLSNAACQVSRFSSESSENCTSYLMAFFSIQRLVAISTPFRAKLFTMRRSVIISVCIIIQALAINSSAFHAYSLDVNHICSPDCHSAVLIPALFALNYVVPNVLLLVSASLTLIALKLANKRVGRAGSATSQSFASDTRVSAGKTTAVLLLLALIRCSIYVPFSVVYVTWLFIPLSSTRDAVRIVSNYFKVLSGLTYIADFLVYMTRIAEFRARVLSLFTCKMPR